MDRKNNFDALRLIAATSVIFTHAFLIAEGNQNRDPVIVLSQNQCATGLVGVFVFFVISGFLVTQSWEQTNSLPRFLAKRALRIYPGRGRATTTFTLYEDDGHTHAYRNGAWAQIVFEMTTTENSILLTAKRSGGYSVPYESIRVVLPETESRPVQLDGHDIGLVLGRT